MLLYIFFHNNQILNNTKRIIMYDIFFVFLFIIYIISQILFRIFINFYFALFFNLKDVLGFQDLQGINLKKLLDFKWNKYIKKKLYWDKNRFNTLWDKVVSFKKQKIKKTIQILKNLNKYYLTSLDTYYYIKRL